MLLKLFYLSNNDYSNSNGMHYELKDVLEIVENNDYEACWDLLDYSLDVMEVIEACRKDAGVVFAADNK